MTIKAIAYSKTFPISNTGIYEKIILEAEIIEGDNVRQCLYDLKRQVESFHYESNKAAEKQTGVQITNPVTADSMEDQINSCTSLKVLDTYRFIVRGNDKLQSIYDNKLKELQK